MSSTVELGSTDPTAERIQLARRLRELHRRVCVPEPACQWCLRAWPCADERWSARVLSRAHGEQDCYDGGAHNS